ncbi:MAG TPA: hypothetical protein PLL78_04380, partial [Fimbriimonadaceae bacterium]|nr:hypothetical protein [Fimbriimonadaceae bacterium]
DDILRQGVQGISDIITIPGQINVDFADVRAVMSNAGPALMGIGYGVGDQRAIQAAQAATSSPLLEQTIHGAKGLLVNITSNSDLTLTEATEALQYIQSLCDEDDANIYFGLVENDELDREVRITVLATGFNPFSPEGRAAAMAPLEEPIFEPLRETPAPSPPERPTYTPSSAVTEGPAYQRVSPKDIWDKAAAERREQPTIDTSHVIDEDIDIPAFIREHKKKQ